MFPARRAFAAFAGVGAAACAAYALADSRKRSALAKETENYEAARAEAQRIPVVRMPHINPGYVIGHGDTRATKHTSGLPRYTRDEVAKHDGSVPANSGRPSVWVTYKNNVYDVTEFVDAHPGGREFIMMAAGGAVDEFWDYWAYHYLSAKVPAFLDKYRIGVLADYEPAAEEDTTDFYVTDPARPPTQLVLSDRPWSSETDAEVLAREPLTPNADFYVRNHAPVPVIDAQAHRICFGHVDRAGRDVETSSFTVAELKARFPTQHITSVLQCGGNRGGEMMQLGTTAFSGTPYYDIGPGMLGCAAWAGIKLSDVIKHVYPELSGNKAAQAGKHLVFEGADGYVASFPLEHVADPSNDALLATEMNDEALPPDHGAPVRLLIPGSIGARNVKWVSKVRVSDHETDACWNGVYYKHGDGRTSIVGMPLTSLILQPRQGQCVEPNNDGTIKVQGIAWAGMTGNIITKVEVSTDLKTWHPATLRVNDIQRENDQSSKAWAWTRWECEIPATAGDVYCRAEDAAGNTQPATTWNPKGYLYNGWHRVRFHTPRPAQGA